MVSIAIATHKGGPGKTVTSINLSAALARMGKRTLLVDLDPQGHATLGLGLDIALDEPTISDALRDRSAILPVRKISETLSVAPANISLAKVAEALYAAIRREERLTKALSGRQKEYDFAVVDCPPSLGTLTTNALACADWVIIPCEMGARAADGIVDLLEVLRDLRGETFDSWRILLNKVDTRKTVTNETVQKSLEPHRGRILKTTIGVSEMLNQAQILGKDIFRFDQKSRAAESFERLTREVVTLVGG